MAAEDFGRKRCGATPKTAAPAIEFFRKPLREMGTGRTVFMAYPLGNGVFEVTATEAFL
jgi:hypothetical protein